MLYNDLLASEVVDKKYYGKVYTPKHIVDSMLAPVFAGQLGYQAICDPACGSGDFLVPIAEELCQRIRSNSEDKESLLHTLGALTGYDVDKEAVAKCQQRLLDVSMRMLGYTPDTVGRILHIDAMDAVRNEEGKFDYVIGNPPYVRIQNLESHRRERIKREGWTYYRGSSDLYIVFYELGMRLLRSSGELIYISPSGWLRSDAGRAMREDLLTNHSVISVSDYGAHQVFPKVSTYTGIFHFRNGYDPSIKPVARKYIDNGFSGDCTLVRNSSRWSVLSAELAGIFGKKAYLTLGSVADVHVGIQTLADKVFVLSVLKYGPDSVTCHAGGRAIKLERDAVRKIFKASVMKNGHDKVNRIVIYPYDNKGRLLPENEIKTRWPIAYGWLLRNKGHLLSRDKGTFDPERWYAYGREVSILSGFGEKILTSGMNREPNFQKCIDPDALFYSGYCIKPKPGVNWNRLLIELNGNRMNAFIRAFSQPFRNGWYSYAKRYIQDFPVSKQVLDHA